MVAKILFSELELSTLSSPLDSVSEALPNIKVGLAINTTPPNENNEHTASNIEYFSDNIKNAKNAVTIGTKNVKATASDKLKYCKEKYIPKTPKTHKSS